MLERVWQLWHPCVVSKIAKFLLQPGGYGVPVYYIPESIHVVWAAVLEIEVIRVFPDVQP
jgi:hypothetical protein